MPPPSTALARPPRLPRTAHSLPRPSAHPDRHPHPARREPAPSAQFKRPSRAERLPVELLSYIFLLGYDDGIDPARPFKRRDLESDANFEVLVSHVCHRWRQVALDTPSLWTSIRLRKPAHLQRGALYVQRSRHAPLDILLDTVAAEDYEPVHRLGIHEFDAGFDVAIDHTHRWRSLIVKVCDLPCKERARIRLRDCPPIPKLETLQLYHVQEWSDAANMFTATAKPPIPILNNDVPSLVNASLIGVNLAYKLTNYLCGLRHLELALHSESCRPTSAEFEHILRECPDLEHLSLHYSGPQVDGTSTGPVIRLEKLTELILANMDVDVLGHVLRRVSMPNLRLLELDLPELHDGLDFTPVIEWISMPQSPAFPALERLCVVDLSCSVGAWTRWLRSLSHLRHLELRFGGNQFGLDMFAPLLDKAPEDATDAPSVTETAASSSPSPSPPSSVLSGASPPADTAPTKDAKENKATICLPVLEELKVCGLPSKHLCNLASFRVAFGYPVPRFFVHIKSLDEDTDELEQHYSVKYYGVEEVLDGDDDEEGDEDDEEYSDEDGDEEGRTGSTGDTRVGEDDGEASYDDEDDDYDDDERTQADYGYDGADTGETFGSGYYYKVPAAS